MIVWLNGAFGVGKTTTARVLRPLLAGAGSYDPERLGWLLQRTVGRMQRGDFQHLDSWRRGTTLLVRRAARRHRTVIVPMTVLRPDYLDELLGRLRDAGHDVRHATLDATAPVLHARIAADEADPATTQWRRGHLEVYSQVRHELAARGTVVDTTGRTPDQVATAVATRVTDSPMQPPAAR